MTAPWEPHQDAYALRRWDEGASAREIATELELMGPKRSRSAIIGRLYRLGAPKRPSPKVATYQSRAKKKRQAQPKMTTRKGIRTAPRPGPARRTSAA